MKFCTTCNNLLYINIHNEHFTFKCIHCNKPYKANDVDTLRYEFSKKSNFGIYEQRLRNAQKDATNIKAYIDCPKCKHYICKQIELTQEMKLFNICEKCGHKWLYDGKNKTH